MHELEQYLWSLTVDDVKDLKRKLELSGTCKNKRDFIEIIMAFYRTPNWLEDYFSTLEGFDKEYATLMIQEDFNPIYEEVSTLLKKYNIQRNWNGKIEDNLKFMIEGEVPEAFKPALSKLVPPLEVSFKPVDELNIDEGSIYIENTKNPLKKFDDFLMFINKNKIKATEKKEYIPKSSIIKFIEKSGIIEIFKTWSSTQEEFKSQDDTVVTNGIVSLLMCASVIMVYKGYFDVGSNYSKYVKMSSIDKAKFLLDKYLNCNYIEINEIDRLTNCDFKYRLPLNLQAPRQKVVDYIKKLPIDSWVQTSSIKYFMRIKDTYFLRDNIGEIIKKDGYRNWYYKPSFGELECAFIDSVLTDYLSILGIVDIYVRVEYDDYSGKSFIDTDYVKLSGFGSHVLGLTGYEMPLEVIKPLIITPNFEIIIEESSKRAEYELYFDHFFEKTFEDASKTIYKLDFLGVAKSYDEYEDVMSYILAECPVIPEGVMDKFEVWSRTLGEITIKTVTILEAPKEILESLLRNKKIAKYEKKSSLEHIIIPSKKSKEVKKSIESLELFCEIEK